MKIKISYRKEGKLELLRFADYPNIEMAKRFLVLSMEEKEKALSKVNLIFEYKELIKAKELTFQGRTGVYRRMILFMKHCPNFKIVKLPYFKSGSYPELFQAEYLDNEVIVNLEKNKNHYQGSEVFHITLK